MSWKEQWEKIYASKQPEEFGWYEPHLRIPLEWIGDLNLPHDARIIDVGGGASTLVDDLLAQGYAQVTVLDLLDESMSMARARLGRAADKVSWLEGDITRVELPRDHFDLWHDRAVLHFLTDPESRGGYANTLQAALKAGGRAIIGVFAPEAPPRCSGLPVERYSAAALQQLLGPRFEAERQRKDLHITPAGVRQMYLYCQFRKTMGEP